MILHKHRQFVESVKEAKAGGRKPTGRKKIFVSTSVSGSKDEIDMIKAKALKANKTVSRFVIDLISSLPE